MTQLFHLKVKNDVSEGRWQFLTNDDDLSHVEEKDAGQFTSQEIAHTCRYIIEAVDGNSQFEIIQVK